MKANAQVRSLKKTLAVHIEPLNYKPDSNFLLNKWKGVLDKIEEILEKGNTHFCFQELYQTINDLISFEIPANVIQTFEALFMQHAKNIGNLFRDLLQFSNIDEFFSNFNSIWEKITLNFNLLRKILVKFEKKFFSLTDNTLHQGSVWTLYLNNLKSILTQDKDFLQTIIQHIMCKISEYRKSIYSNFNDKENVTMTVDLSGISESINLLWETGLYKELFNDIFLQSSKDYYSNLSEDIITTQSIENYISFVEKSFEIEAKLITSYLNEYSFKKLINNIETQFIYEKKNKILQKVFSQSHEICINANTLEFLKRVYLLFKRIKLDEELRTSWLSFINNTANIIYKEFNKSYTVVVFFENLLKLKKNIDDTVRDAFLGDEKFKTTAKEGFVKTLNLKPNAAADYFARYVDHILTNSDVSEKQVLSKIDEFMRVFKYLDSKDMFESFHIKKLASRLLYNLTNSTKGEKYLIEKLRSECGNVLVTKSEEMLSDIETSMDLTLNFKDQENKLECNYYVLSTYSWPVNKIITGVVSDATESLHKNFTSFHKAKFAGKSLNWHLPWCSGDISYSCNNKQVLLQVNGVQAAILLKYTRTRDNITLSDLLSLTSIEKEDLIYNLNILTNNHHILVYDKANDRYKLNHSFTPTKSHMIITDFTEKGETSIEEIKEVEERNWEDRKHVIDALLMKVLKAKKQMKVHDLISNVLGMIKFPCEISMVSTRINYLLSNGYLTKDEKDEELIKYNP